MKKIYTFWVISILFSFLGFYLIENTFTIKPDVISGNGNLGILIIMLLSPIFLTSYFLTYKLARKISDNALNKTIRVVVLSFLLICGAVLIIPIVNYTNELIIALGGTPSNPDSRTVGLINIQIVYILMFIHFY